MKQILTSAAVALFLGVPQSSQQPAQPVPDSPAQQGAAIPDAPRPQTSGIQTVAPGKGTTPTSNGTPAATPDDPFQKPVTDSLPSSPAPSSAVHEDDGAAPDLPSTPVGAEALPLYTARLRVNYVEVPFTVKDSKGNLVAGLTWRDVRVYENGVRQHIARFVVDPVPISIAVVIDQSLPFDVMTRVNNALDALQGAFASYDEVAVFTYNNGPRMQTDFTGGQSPRLMAVVDRAKTAGREPIYYAPGEALSQGINLNGGAQEHINPLTSGGPGSPQGVSHSQVPREVHTLNDAILAAAQATTHAGKGRRRIVYVISDGKELGSKAKTKEVIKYLQTNKIAVFATLVGDSSVAGMGFLNHLHVPLMMRDNVLPLYTAATGGGSYAEFRTRGIEQSFAKITEQVRNQYMAGYYTREPFIDGKFRKLEVRVLRNNLEVIAKDGYWPLASDVTPSVVQQLPASQ